MAQASLAEYEATMPRWDREYRNVKREQEGAGRYGD